MRFLAASFLLLLTACTVPAALQGPPPPTPTSLQTNFGRWFVTPHCALWQEGEGIHLYTPGDISNHTLYLKVVTPAPVQSPPQINLTAQPKAHITVLGSGHHWGADIPYTPLSAAHYMHPNSFIGITIHEVGAETSRTVAFPTDGLIDGVSWLGNTCLKK